MLNGKLYKKENGRLVEIDPVGRVEPEFLKKVRRLHGILTGSTRSKKPLKPLSERPLLD